MKGHENMMNAHGLRLPRRPWKRTAGALCAGSLLLGGLTVAGTVDAQTVDDEIPGVELSLSCQGQMEQGVWKYGLGINNMRATDVFGSISGKKANDDLVTSGLGYGRYRAVAETVSAFFGYNELEDGQIIVSVDGETAAETIPVDCVPNQSTTTSPSTTTIATAPSSGTIPGVDVILNCNMAGRGVLTVENNRTTAISGEIQSTKSGQTTVLLPYEAPANDISANVLPASAEDSVLTVTVNGESAVVERALDCVPNQSTTTSSTTTTTTTTLVPPGGQVTSSLEAVVASAPLPLAARSALLEVLRLLRLLFGWLGV
ncbi:MAG: hypothetical protein ACLGI2_09435 [Acidimicrobiia bacterium]